MRPQNINNPQHKQQHKIHQETNVQTTSEQSNVSGPRTNGRLATSDATTALPLATLLERVVQRRETKARTGCRHVVVYQQSKSKHGIPNSL